MRLHKRDATSKSIDVCCGKNVSQTSSQPKRLLWQRRRSKEGQREIKLQKFYGNVTLLRLGLIERLRRDLSFRSADVSVPSSQFGQGFKYQNDAENCERNKNVCIFILHFYFSCKHFPPGVDGIRRTSATHRFAAAGQKWIFFASRRKITLGHSYWIYLL